MAAISHLVGVALTVHGCFHRQRCQWCGHAFIDQDLSLVATSDGSKPVEWEPGRWIEVTEGNPSITTLLPDIEDGKYPKNSCMARDCDPSQSKSTLHVVGDS